MEVAAITSKGWPDWDNYGLSQSVHLTTQWQAMKLTFDAKNGTRRANSVPMRRRNGQDLDR